jgi:hypothetical protein
MGDIPELIRCAREGAALQLAESALVSVGCVELSIAAARFIRMSTPTVASRNNAGEASDAG